MLRLEPSRIPPGRWPFLNAVFSGLTEIEHSLEPDIDLTEGTGEILITGCMRAYKQAVMARVLDLAESAVTCWNAGLSIGTIASSRSLLETIATFHSFMKRSQEAADAKDWAKIGRLVDAYAFSTSVDQKGKTRSEDAPSRIGTIVKEFIGATQPGCEIFWDQICDRAHPNGQRMIDGVGTLTNKRYVAKPASESEPALFVAVFNVLYSCCWLSAATLDFDILLEVIRNGGELPADHHLIVSRTLVDNSVSEISAEIGQLNVGPFKNEKATK